MHRFTVKRSYRYSKDYLGTGHVVNEVVGPDKIKVEREVMAITGIAPGIPSGEEPVVFLKKISSDESLAPTYLSLPLSEFAAVSEPVMKIGMFYEEQVVAHVAVSAKKVTKLTNPVSVQAELPPFGEEVRVRTGLGKIFVAAYRPPGIWTTDGQEVSDEIKYWEAL